MSKKAAVVAQAVERRDSVRAGRVQIPQIYSRWALSFFLKQKMKYKRPYSSFFFPVSYHHFKHCERINCDGPMNTENKIKVQKEAG